METMNQIAQASVQAPAALAALIAIVLVWSAISEHLDSKKYDI